MEWKTITADARTDEQGLSVRGIQNIFKVAQGFLDDPIKTPVESKKKGSEKEFRLADLIFEKPYQRLAWEAMADGYARETKVSVVDDKNAGMIIMYMTDGAYIQRGRSITFV